MHRESVRISSGVEQQGTHALDARLLRPSGSWHARADEQSIPASAHLAIAHAHSIRGELEAAWSAAQAALVADPEQSSVPAMLGQVEHARHHPDLACQWFDRAIELAPHHAQLRINRSAARLARGDLAGAEGDALHALTIDDAAFGAWLNLALAREADLRPRDALVAYVRALLLQPSSLPARRGRAHCTCKSGSGHRCACTAMAAMKA